jgi:epsilon-lactone hydrolase
MAGDDATREPRRPPVPVVRLAARLLGRFVFRDDLPIDKQRARLASLAKTGALPTGVSVSNRTIGGVPAAELTHTDSTPDLVVIHLHGGGYIVGTPETPQAWAAPLAARSGATIVIPDYRLAPEHPYPAALDDAAAVWKEVTTTVDPGRVVLGGDSAGAGLALALTARLRDEGSPLPAGLVLISPWLDLTANRRSDPDLARRDPMLTAAWLERAADAYSGGVPLAEPGISPLLGSLAGLPPTLVQAGADDILIVDSIRFARDTAAAGGDVTLTIGNDLWHDFPMQAGMLAAADAAVRQAAAFVTRVTDRRSTDRPD